MPVNVTSALRQALSQLEGEKSRLDRQIEAVRSALDGVGGGGRAPAARKPGRRPRSRMSTEARRAASQRMKAYWAKRRGASGGKPSKKSAQAK
jgi:hypothetical protein